ncbi:hypothetical protein ACPC27_08550 [Streptomyces cellulosae]
MIANTARARWVEGAGGALNAGLVLLPLAVRILRDTAPSQIAGGWYDDDLLYAVVTRKTQVWEQFPGLARELKATVETPVDLSRHVREEAAAFCAAVPEES